MMRLKKLSPVALPLMASLLVGCGGERTNDPIQVTSDSIQLAQAELVNKQILPSVAGFKSEAMAFEQDVAALCSATVDETAVANLQDDWKALMLAWQALEPFNFGPLNDDLFSARIDFINSYRKRGTDYTASVRTSLIDQMAATDTIDFSALPFNLVGLLALEIISFETHETTPSTELADLAAEFNASTRKCYLLENYAEQITGHADYISDGWNVDYLDEDQSFKDLYLSGTLDEGSESLAALFTTLQSHLDYMKKRNVLSRTAQISGTSYDNAMAAIEAVESVLEGADSSEENFFAQMELAGNADTVVTVRANIASAKSALQSSDQPSFEAAAGLLDGNFKREIPDSLAVNLGINFSDGD